MKKEQLILVILDEFRKRGFNGVSIGNISKITGLAKSSLYHYFPDGKIQMIKEIINFANQWIKDELISILVSDQNIKIKFDIILNKLCSFYSNGEYNCLIDVIGIESDKPEIIIELKSIYFAFEDIFTKLFTGNKIDNAKEQAVTALSILQGSLVLSRITNNRKIFLQQIEIIKMIFNKEY